MNRFAGTNDTNTEKEGAVTTDEENKKHAMPGTEKFHEHDPKHPEDARVLRTQDDVANANRDTHNMVRFVEAARQADAPQNPVDSSYPRYVFRKGSGRVQGDTGAFTAESMIVHKPEEFQALLDSGIWCRSPAEAGEMSKEDKEKRGIRQQPGEPLPAGSR